MKTAINSAKPVLGLVHDLFLRRDFAEAFTILERLVERHPDFPVYKDKLEECKCKLANGDQLNDRKRAFESKGFNSASPALSGDLRHKEKQQPVPVAARDGEEKTATELSSSPSREHDASDVSSTIELARADLLNRRYEHALAWAKAAISADNSQREAYKLAEQAAIELERFEEANAFFLAQPPVVNPPEPRKRGKNPCLPPQFKTPPIVGASNDYRHILERASMFKAEKRQYSKSVAIIVPVYNRNKILANTLAGLTHQTYPKELIQVYVVDDGSSDDVLGVIKKYESKLSLYYIRQIDAGFRLAAARNLGVKCSQSDCIIFMDADILPLPEDVESYMRALHVTEQAVLIGHRRYVDVSSLSDDDILANINVARNLPSISPKNDVSGKKDANGESVDWRFSVYEKTDYLLNDPWPFTKAAGGNIAFSRRLLDIAGNLDEEFQAWGCEDGEHGYRMYNAGAYFIPMTNIVSLHQEPLNDGGRPEVNEESESFRAMGHKITRQLFSRKCPAPTVRKYESGADFDIPKVSIYIPAFNASEFIVDAVRSCLDQTFGDLEVCICDDGSTDDTLAVLERHFSGDQRVRWIAQENGGIGSATNAAISLCRGMYIGQLDADDMLKPNAVRTCVAVLDRQDVDAVYTDCDYIDRHGKYIRDAWCGGEYSRDWMVTGMIATHFRMFKRRVWARTAGCNTHIKNAVDLDLWLKISENGNIAHIHESLYSYRWHGSNTSILHRKQQEMNHLRVVSDSIRRRKLDMFWTLKSAGNPLNPREFKFLQRAVPSPATPSDVIFLIPTCEKYEKKMAAIRATWVKELGTLGFRYYFLRGAPESRLSEVVGDTLYVPCNDNYESLLLKLALGYEFLHRNCSFNYVYKIDDDCYPNLAKLTKTVLPQLADAQYAGGAVHPKGSKMNDRWHYGKCSSSKFDKPYKFNVAPFAFAKGGYGYFLRRDVLPILFEEAGSFRRELDEGIYSYEDVRVSELLHGHGVALKTIENYAVTRSPSDGLKNHVLIFDIGSPQCFHDISISPMA